MCAFFADAALFSERKVKQTPFNFTFLNFLNLLFLHINSLIKYINE